ncbi:putative transferase CAF17 homolog, mitochondrial [Tachysurus vachellii]|nr:putative transferase CAF17 homolog, mitochondrial [Tachysurus vachellii]
MNMATLLRGVFRVSRSARAHGGVIRRYGTGEMLWTCHTLTHRDLIKVHGQDTHSFLQGLITNDISALEDSGHTALYTHLLSVQGRSLYDVMLYSLKDSSYGLSCVLLECDSSVVNSITRHLKMYKIRRKVSVEVCPDLSLWALLGLNTHPAEGSEPEPEPELRKKDDVVVMVRDPRTPLMGWRLITRNQEKPSEIITACNHGSTEDYHRHRYKIGVPEGVQDLPPGEALPLESNLVFLNGISFSKGCYIGQELTARTHYTGVVRKRLMPLSLSVPVENLPMGGTIEAAQGKVAGKLRSGVGELGLGLVRLSHAKEKLTVSSTQGEGVTVTASVPDWWPKELKDKL